MGSNKVASTIATGVTVLFAMEILVFVCGLLNKIVLTQWLTPADIGIIGLVNAWVGIATLIFLFGIPGSMTKFISEYLSKKIDPGKLVSAGLKIVLASSVAGSVIAFLLSDVIASVVFDAPEAGPAFKIAALILFFLMLYRLLSYCIMGFQQMGYFSLMESVYTVSMLVFTVALLYLGYGVNGAVWAMVFPAALVCILSYLVVRKVVRIDIFQSIDRNMLATLIAFGVPFYASVVIEMVLGMMDTIMLGILTDLTQVGYYSLALWLMGIVIMVTRPLNTAVFPAFSAIFAKDDRHGLEKIFGYSMKYNVYLLLPAALGMIVLADPIIRLFFPDFLPATLALQILAIAAIFSSLRAMGTKFLSAVGETRPIMFFIIITMVVNIVLNYFFIIWYGIEGAAVAMTISYMLFMGLCFSRIFTQYRINLNFVPVSLIASLLMAGCVYGFMSLNLLPALELLGIAITPYIALFAAILLGAIVYGVSLYLLGGLDQVDKEFLGGLIRKFTGAKR